MKISGVDVRDLKKEYGTPLYIYDAAHLKNNMRLFKNNFKSSKFETEVLFASKAFNVKEMVRLVQRNGLGLDCVSLGEMFTAINVGFDAKNIYLHGNNKSIEEIARACSALRNQIRLDQYKDDPEGLAKLKERNLEKYGHEEGPLPDELYAKYNNTWEMVLQKCYSTNAGMDACCGVYDKYFYLYNR